MEDIAVQTSVILGVTAGGEVAVLLREVPK